MADELTNFLNFYDFGSYEADLRNSDVLTVDDLKRLPMSDINELCEGTSMDATEKLSFVNACIALKNGSYEPPPPSYEPPPPSYESLPIANTNNIEGQLSEIVAQPMQTTNPNNNNNVQIVVVASAPPMHEAPPVIVIQAPPVPHQTVVLLPQSTQVVSQAANNPSNFLSSLFNNTNTFNPSMDQLQSGMPFSRVVGPPTRPTTVIGFQDGIAKPIGYGYGWKQNKNIISLIVTILMWSALVVACVFFTMSPLIAYILFGVTALLIAVNFIESQRSGTLKYLYNVMREDGAVDFLQNLRNETVVITWHVSCYHMETHRDSDGNSHTKRVTTWTGSTQYVYSQCRDVSGELVGLDSYKLIKLKMSKEIGFANEDAKSLYDRARIQYRKNNWRDVRQDFRQTIAINGFKERVLVGEVSDWMSTNKFVIWSLLGMSPCFRYKLNSKCAKAQFYIIKQIS